MRNWYALHTKPDKEKLVARLLEDRRLEHFLPLARDARRSQRQRPFFPGYLFARLDVHESGLAVVEWLPGVRGVVSADGEPIPVADSVVTHLRERLDQIELEGGVGAVAFRKGDRVVVVRGPFAGYDALFDARLRGPDRVRILLQLISRRAVAVELSTIDIEPHSA